MNRPAENQKSQSRGKFQNPLSAEIFAHRVIIWWLPLLYLLISSAFYLRTYDSAQVKITLMQMGGLALLGMWVSRLVEAGSSAFNKEDLVCLSPFLAYLAVGIFSFLHAPYNMSSVDFFLRHFFFMTAALIAIYELEGPAAERLTKILIWAAWIAILYGTFQFVDNAWFPPGPGKGIDPFIWRGAFGTRVFSTYGNPNFYGDFLVITFPIILTQHFKAPKFSNWILIALLLLNLMGTGTKGAWVGFAFVMFFFGVIAFRYFKTAVEPYRKAVLTIVTLGVLGFGGVVAKDLQTRMVSVNFRLFTLEATWEMIRTQPLLGTGVGSFPPVYPAFRRPPIFHIEGKHNTETDHSENEYIEQLMDNGILGFGIFIWLIISTLSVGFRSLEQLTGSLAQKDGSPHPRAYDLLGYMVAFMGMLSHNFFDVSMRFVSSGVYLGLLSGMIVNLARGKALFELHGANPATLPGAGNGNSKAGADAAANAGPGGWAVLSEFLIWPARLAAWGGLGYAAFKFCKEFSEVQGPLGRMVLGGEILQWWIAWSVFGGCVASLTWVFLRLTYLSEKPLVPILILLMLKPMDIFWGYFKADVHHNIAIYFSKERNWELALRHYRIVARLNPNFVMAHYFRGNVFNDRFNMTKIYNPDWGDENNVPRDDYERALGAYDEVRALAPNYVQTHHQVGALHQKRGDWAQQNGRPDEAQKYYERAIVRYKMYEAIDPVFQPNFFRLGQVYMIQKRYAEAAAVYEAAIGAYKCSVDHSLISNKTLRKTILSYQQYIDGVPGETHPVHLHESPDGYLNLGNAYFLMEVLEKAETAYRRGLALEPTNEHLKRNLTVVYQKAQSLGRLKPLPPPPTPPNPFDGPFTGYQIVPAKK